MKQQNQKISNGVKNILPKTLKFISSRLVYLIIGLFLAISITYVYAAWNDAKTGDSGQLSQSNWNTLVNEVHNKCGSNCDATATGATASSDILTETNWNNLVDLTSSTLTDCTADNNGKCFINQVSKSALDTDLAAGNIISGKTIFGVAGSYSAPPPPNCTADNGGTCYISQATKSALDADLAAGNIKSGVNIFGVTGNVAVNEHVECRCGTATTCYTNWHILGIYGWELCWYPTDKWFRVEFEAGSNIARCTNSLAGVFPPECRIAP